MARNRSQLQADTISGTIDCVSRIAKKLAAMRNAPKNVTYHDLYNVCRRFFGEPRQKSSSHAVFKTRWPGDPRVNIQRGKNGKAKPYQVEQVLAAIDKVQKEQE